MTSDVIELCSYFGQILNLVQTAQSDGVLEQQIVDRTDRLLLVGEELFQRGERKIALIVHPRFDQLFEPGQRQFVVDFLKALEGGEDC